MKKKDKKIEEFKERFKAYIEKVTPEGFINIVQEKYGIPLEPITENKKSIFGQEYATVQIPQITEKQNAAFDEKMKVDPCSLAA